MNDNIVAQIRTTVPVIVGAVLAWLAKEHGVIVDESAGVGLTTGLVALLTSIYYAAARFLENKVPSLGWLLGNPKTPTYSGNVDA